MTGRREFLRRATLASAGTLALGTSARPARGAAGTGRVVHVHHGRAATWPKAAGTLYRSFVDLAAVEVMLDRAVMALKGAALADAWSAVFHFPDNERRRLSIKVNCNNATDSVDGAGNDIDAIPESAMAVVRGFVRAGGRPSNVNIYDSTNTAPARFIAAWFRERVRAVYPEVLFDAPWSSPPDCGPTTCVAWDPAHTVPPPSTRYMGAILLADYVVNIPIVKRHGQAGMTLGFKNHFGSVDRCDRLHPYVFYDTPEASVLADIMNGPVHESVTPLWQKTVLTVGDMLFGQACKNFLAPPEPWVTFRNEWPNSLIVSDDVVAADSVMSDLLEAEPISGSGCGAIGAWSRRYLERAAQKGQGVHEHLALPSGRTFDPARMTYDRIRYSFVDVWPSGAELTVTRLSTAVHLQWQHYFPGLCEVLRATRPDFADGVRIGVALNGRYADPDPPPRAFYRIRYIA